MTLSTLLPQRLAGALLIVLIAYPWLGSPWFGPLPQAPQLVVTALALVGVGLVLLVRGGWKTVDWALACAAGWLLAALLSSAIALLQYWGQDVGLQPWIQEHPSASGEGFANLRQRNQFATLTSIGLCALLWFARQAETLSRRQWRALALAAALLALGNATTFSRTGLVQWVGLALVCALWRPWRPALRMALLALGLFGVAMLALPPALSWVQSGAGTGAGAVLLRFTEDPGAGGRKVLWANVLHLISLRPWLGWGWGELDYAHFMTLYNQPRFSDLLDNAHNLPLQLAVELGIPFALAAVGLGLSLTLRARPWAQPCPARQLGWAVLGVVGVHSLLEYPLWYGPFQMAVLLAITLSLGVASADTLPTPWSTARRQRWALALLLAVPALAYAGWDYWRVSQLYRPAFKRAEAYRVNPLALVSDSRLFRHEVQFAALSIAPLDMQTAESVRVLATEMLHVSPEAKVVRKLIASLRLLGREDEARFYEERLQAAYPGAASAPPASAPQAQPASDIGEQR